MKEPQFEVEIKTPNKMFLIKNKMVRSPVTFVIPESQLSYVNMKIEIEGIDNYTINPFVAKTKEKIETLDSTDLAEENHIEKIEDDEKESSILEKLLDG